MAPSCHPKHALPAPKGRHVFLAGGRQPPEHRHTNPSPERATPSSLPPSLKLRRIQSYEGPRPIHPLDVSIRRAAPSGLAPSRPHARGLTPPARTTLPSLRDSNNNTCPRERGQWTPRAIELHALQASGFNRSSIPRLVPTQAGLSSGATYPPSDIPFRPSRSHRQIETRPQ